MSKAKLDVRRNTLSVMVEALVDKVNGLNNQMMEDVMRYYNVDGLSYSYRDVDVDEVEKATRKVGLALRIMSWCGEYVVVVVTNKYYHHNSTLFLDNVEFWEEKHKR